MNIITLPVAPLTRKLLLAEYGPEPISLGARNLLYRQMCYRVDETPWMERHQQILSSTIQINVNRHLWEKVRQQPHQVGYHIYELQKDRMFTWVEGRVDAGEEQLGSIREYLLNHGIEEDEFSLETAYRLWKRFKENRLSNTPPIVPRLITGFPVKLTPNQALLISEKIKLITSVWCYDLHKATKGVITPYVLYEYTDLTTRSVAQRLNRKQPSIVRSVQRARIALDNYPRMNEAFRYVLSTIDHQATP